MFKTHKVVILPTEKAEKCLLLKNKQLMYQPNYSTQDWLKYNETTSHHLYIISNEEIEEGDWILANQGVHQVTDIKNGKYPYGTLNYKGDKIYHHKSWEK